MEDVRADGSLLALTVDVDQRPGRTAAPPIAQRATSLFEGAFGGCAGREKRREIFSAGNELIDAVYTVISWPIMLQENIPKSARFRGVRINLYL